MKRNKKRNWYSQMQRMGVETGWGMKQIVRTMRAIADVKAKTRMTLIDGEFEASTPEPRWRRVQVINKRSGKVVGSRLVRPKPTPKPVQQEAV